MNHPVPQMTLFPMPSSSSPKPFCSLCYQLFLLFCPNMAAEQTSAIPAKFFVGGLAAETTEDHLRAHFEQFGELCDVAVMKDQYGVPRCFGFVQFADANAHTCRPSEEHIICDKKVDVKAAVPKEAINEGAPIRTNKIFVGGLARTTNEEGVKAHFSRFGSVTEVLMKFTETGESRGFCFVEFDSEDIAEEVPLLHSQQSKGSNYNT